MNLTFSFSRLLQLVRKQWIENARLYVFATLALAGIIGLIFLFWLNTSNDHFNEEPLFVIFAFGLLIAGGIFASMSFSMLGEKEKGTYWLGLPASHLEKLLCVIFYNLVVFTLVYTACLLLLEKTAVAYAQKLVAGDPLNYHFKPMGWNDINGFGQVFPFFIYAFFAVQPFYLLGSVYFSRFSFVLTTVAGAALIGIFIGTTFYLFDHMHPKAFSWNGSSIECLDMDNNGDSVLHRYQLSGIPIDSLSFLIKFIWAPVFWVATWYRLKEKEI